jgi:diguanylate cyclase (GGDEF)-like protein/PAS domain S-box-containing protein
LPHTSKTLQRELATYLLGIVNNKSLTKAIDIHGFDLPANYTAVEQVMRELRVPPFDKTPEFTLRDIWARYQSIIVAGGLAMLVLVLLWVKLYLVNRQLRHEKALSLHQSQELRDNHRLLDSIVENVPMMILMKRASDLRFVLINRAGELLTGTKRDAMVGRDYFDLLPKEQAQQYADSAQKFLSGSEDLEISENTVDTPKGSRILHSKKLIVRDDDGSPQYLLTFSEDITDRKRAEQEIEALAFFDPLTGLPNRRLYVDRLRQSIAVSARSGDDVALLLIDLDNFKTLNDTRGHEYGDLLLQQVGHRLKSCLREGDTASRVGGDEFILILKELSADRMEAAAQTTAVAEKILIVLSAPFDLNGYEMRTSASIGATLLNRREITTDDVQREADIAMYQAKKSGRNMLRFFDPAMQAVVSARAALEEDIGRALAQNQFQLHYQVQVDSTGRTVGAEALLRWPHPERGMVPPADFIPLAEETGQILAIGHWVLEMACRQLFRWSGHAGFAQLTLSVNVSSKQFEKPGFADEVLSLVDAIGANPAKLKLELTESLLLHNPELIIETMSSLKRRGIQFSIDDFGTGYSSLSYLKRLPLSQLKIDKSFVRDVITDPQDAAIARTVVALAASLDLDVIAEGVETQAQMEFLFLSGCRVYQGYYFGRPVPIEQFEAALASA